MAGRDIGQRATLAWAGDCASLVCEKPWTERVTFQEWLKMPIAGTKGVLVTAGRLIHETANNLGPAHYSVEVSATMAEMRAVSLGGAPSCFRPLLTFEEVLPDVGKRFLHTY
jgi:hypothetical protein